MTTMTVQIPSGQVGWFEQMLSSMGWSFRKEEAPARVSEKPRESTIITQKKQTLDKIDHAFGQLRQMKDGQLEGVNAEELLNEL